MVKREQKLEKLTGGRLEALKARKTGSYDHMTSNEVSLKRNSFKSYDHMSPKVKKTEYIADKLVKIFDAPDSRKYFLKCAWHLSEDEIWSIVEETEHKGVTNPIGLFIAFSRELLDSDS